MQNLRQVTSGLPRSPPAQAGKRKSASDRSVRRCAEADAWATALMGLGPGTGSERAMRFGLDAFFALRDGEGGLRAQGVGPSFCKVSDAVADIGKTLAAWT